MQEQFTFTIFYGAYIVYETANMLKVLNTIEKQLQKHLVNLKYKYKQEEKTTRYKCNISVLIPRPLSNIQRNRCIELIKDANWESVTSNDIINIMGMHKWATRMYSSNTTKRKTTKY